MKDVWEQYKRDMSALWKQYKHDMRILWGSTSVVSCNCHNMTCGWHSALLRVDADDIFDGKFGREKWNLFQYSEIFQVAAIQ